VLVVELEPFLRVLKRLLIRDIINEDAKIGVLEVTRNEAFEPFLSCGVPELQSIVFILIGKVSHKEIDANGGTVVGFETIVNEPVNDGGFPNMLVSQENDFVLYFSTDS